MNSPEQSPEKLTRRIDGWLEHLEIIAADLLDTIDISEMSARERADLSIKLLTQIHHFFALRNAASKSEAGVPSDGTTLSALLRQMRGEMSADEPTVVQETRLCYGEKEFIHG